MSARPPIIIPGPVQQAERTWRRFLAALCLIEFYGTFICWGGFAADSLISDSRLQSVDWISLAQTFRSLTFLGLGRALWLNRPKAWLWTFPIALAYAADLATRGWLQLPLINLSLLGGLSYDPWMGVLVAAGYFFWNRRRGRVSYGWAFFALAWCLAEIPYTFTGLGTGSYYCDALADIKGAGNAPKILTIAVYTALLIGLGVCVLRNRRAARILAIVHATMAGLPVVIHAYLLPEQVTSSIEALMISCPYDPVNPVPWPWLLLNPYTFRGIVGELPLAIGPWILIAWYVRNVPVVPSLPNDGSPYPRRYCRQCYYNLEGATAPRCPECGAEMTQSVFERRE